MTTPFIEPKQLVAAGWTRRSVASEPRLGEAVRVYRDLGLETLLLPVRAECAGEGSAEGCTACFDADEDPDRFQVIYTRPRQGGAKGEDELF